MVSNGFLKRFRKLDAYAKTLDDFRVRTATGGTVTLVCALTILTLLTFEIYRYLTPVMLPAIMVDGGKQEKLQIVFDVSFPDLPCYLLSLDIMDESGEHVTDYVHQVYKERLDPKGNVIEKQELQDLSNPEAKKALEQKYNLPEDYCGPCYGANPDNVEKPCCNTCEEVQRVYGTLGWGINTDNFEQCIREGWKEKTEAQAEEGCRINGYILVNKIRGNFHFSAGTAFSHGATHVHDLSAFLKNTHHQSFKHHIKKLQFGSHNYNSQKQKRTKASELINPLDGTEWGDEQTAKMYQYFIKIVPTEFDYLNGKKLRTFQYSVSRQEQVAGTSGGLPGVFFMLDHSPMRIIYSEHRPTLGSFMTSVCAIIGGIFSVAAIIDSLLYRASKMGKTM